MTAASLPTAVRWELPGWAHDLVDPGQDFPTPEERMALAVELSRRNAEERTGDPFGAAVFDLATCRPVALGVNVVAPSATVAAHAEVVALCLAGAAVGDHHLGRGVGGRIELATSCAPCMMCQGAIAGAGVSSLLIAVREDDTRALGLGGSRRPPEWVDGLRRQGVAVTEDVLRAEGVEVLREYAAREGEGGPT